MTSTAWCSDPRKHAAFGYYQRTPEGPYCTTCRVLPHAPQPSGSEAGDWPEANTPSPDPSPAPTQPTAAIHGDTPATTPAPPAPVAHLPAPTAGNRICPYCGGRFRAKRSDQVWCGMRCRKNAWDRKRYARERAVLGLPYSPRPMRSRGVFKALLRGDA